MRRKIGDRRRRESPAAVLRHLLRLAHDEWGVLERVHKIRTEKESQGRLRCQVPLNSYADGVLAPRWTPDATG